MTVRRYAARRPRPATRATGRLAALLVLAVGLLLPGDRAGEVGAARAEPAAVTPAAESAAPQPPAPRAVVHRYRVWQWNVAGNTMHHGSVSDGLIGAAAASIVGSGSEVATVNELCRQQFEALQAALAAAGWPQDTTDFAVFQPTSRAGPPVCEGQDFGNALFSAATIGSVDLSTLPSDGSGEDRGLLCATLRDLPAMRFCTTHITPSRVASVDGRPANVQQLDDVRERLERHHRAGDTVVIAGDFNAQPDYARLDAWYSSTVDGPANGGNTGVYRELDDADAANCPGYGEWTATGPAGAPPPCGGGGTTCASADGTGCGKIDLVFVREGDIAGGYQADSLDIPSTCAAVPGKPGVYAAGSCSDHRVLVGEVTVRVRPDRQEAPRNRDELMIATK